jgi:thioredoxin reductase (NADPH)
MIIGGGPAGMSASIWCADLGLASVLIESGNDLGGQLHTIYNRIDNYPGLSAANGEEMLRFFLGSLGKRRFALRNSIRVISAELSSLTVSTNDGEKLSARSIVIATGVRRRKLGVAGEEEFVGKGILTSGAKESETAEGRNVVVIGGGDAAIENALILSERARRVTVIHRRGHFKARESFLNDALTKQNVRILANRTVMRFDGIDRLEKILVKNSIDGAQEEIDCDLALVRIGVEPNSELFRPQLEVDENGYIVVSSSCETSIKDVYAIGDIANPHSLNISTAAGNAANAILQIFDVTEHEKRNPKF